MSRRMLILGVLGALLLGGCGIPNNTEVVRLRPGPSTGVSSGDDVSPARITRADTTDKAKFVENYLQAAAGDYAGAAERVKEFLSPDAAVNFKAAGDIKVVRKVEDPLVEPGSPEVSIKVREVGTLSQRGILESSDDGEIRLQFTLRSIQGRQGLFVTKAPAGLLLSDVALDRFYAQRTIYFWNQDNTGLVPDLRYMPLSVPPEQQPTVIIDWLTGGPSAWLAGVVDALPEGTKLIGNVPAVSNDTLQINLSDQAVPPDDPSAPDRLQKQLRWSLLPGLPGTLELAVEHQQPRRYVGTDFLAHNPAYRVVDGPERFVVYNGQVHRLAGSSRADQPVPVIAPAANRNIRMAALATSGDRSYAALVVNESGGRPALRVGAAGAGEQATLRRIGLSGAVGRPVWAKSPVGADAGTSGLVPIGGRLWSFSADGGSIRQVEWPNSPGAITAVAVAPDAHRVALLAGGRLYVAALSSSENGAQLSGPHAVPTVLRDLTAVDWGSESTLVVAGISPENNRVAMMDVSIDGATQTNRLADLGSKPVTYLATQPANPAREEAAVAVAYVVDGAAYDEANPDRLDAGDLAKPLADPPAGVLPGAPFFLN
ncbi:MAG TPA: LpqB family beta-propeller domain-containing protein [Actinoplanes sp.]|nr:LpqB family beta-propeller domain-containing protein [Actinoplanes sp.]